MKLPTKKHEPEIGQWPIHDNYLVYGPPKVGKTQFASQWPEPLILDCEHGTKYVEDAYVLEISSLNELREAYKLCEAAERYETIVLDTVDAAYGWIEEEVCQKRNLDAMGEGSMGSDWFDARNKLMNLIKKFSNLPFNFLIVAHAKEALGEVSARKVTIDLPGKATNWVMGFVDNVLYCQARQENGELRRELVMRPTGKLNSGSRNPVLNEAKTIPLSFEEFENLFNEEVSK